MLLHLMCCARWHQWYAYKICMYVMYKAFLPFLTPLEKSEFLVDPRGAHRALCPWCAKSWLFYTTGSHGSQGPNFCSLHPLVVHQGFFFLFDACHGSEGPEFYTPCFFELVMYQGIRL